MKIQENDEEVTFMKQKNHLHLADGLLTYLCEFIKFSLVIQSND